VTRVFVPGVPLSQGNLRRGRHGGIYEQDRDRVNDWRATVRIKAAKAMADREPSRAAIVINARFLFTRPKSHLRKDGTPRDSAPRLPITRSTRDIDKLERAVLDALTGVVFVDDAQVVSVNKGKEYSHVPGLDLTWHTIA
jgi:crossover junction endodeoxyribonuclease RusA